MNSSICALGGMHKKKFEMSNFKKILIKIENVEKMHQKYIDFSILVKNEITCKYFFLGVLDNAGAAGAGRLSKTYIQRCIEFVVICNIFEYQ